VPYRWEFEKDGEALVVDVSGPLIVDDADLMFGPPSMASV
jgi:hypothetical protein